MCLWGKLTLVEFALLEQELRRTLLAILGSKNAQLWIIHVSETYTHILIYIHTLDLLYIIFSP